MSDLVERLRAAVSDRYTIEREIGSGGMALVLLAQDLKHNRRVAIKVLRPELGYAVGADRFLREIEIAARLTHPHVLPLHDSGTAGDLLYYVMPFVEGESLRDRLTREKQLPLLDALRIGSEVADALAFAHARGVVHRDIKPENILLLEGHAMVSDFGIARAISAVGGDRLTGTGMAVGTLHYMSPEQATGHDALDGRTDVYSLGCVVYEMLTGESPFAGGSAPSVMARIITEPSPAMAKTRAGVPPEVERLVARALAKEPDERLATAAEFHQALSHQAALVSGGTVSHGRAPGARLSRRTKLAIGIAAGAVAVAGAFALLRGGVGRDAPVAANRIAVIPFAVHGSQAQAYLSEGVVDLLSRNLEGVDNLQTVDPGTVMSALRRDAESTRVIDAGMGRALVRRFGAGAFILGSVNSAGGRMRIQAALYRGDTDADTDVRASVEGDTAQLLELVDRLAAELLVKRHPGAEHRLTQTAALTTRSLPALKAFLNAEQQLRGGQLDSAIAGYQRAVAEDSTFALAYYRLAIAAGWRDKHALSSEAAAKALKVGSRLTKRDRLLLTAYAAYRGGDADGAERQYRAVLEDFPDDLEAEFQLGDLLFQYNPLRGRPRLEARPLLDLVLAHDPGFL